MKIKCRPVALGELQENISCSGCYQAWKYYRKGRRLIKLFYEKGANEKNKSILRRGCWLLVRSAQALFEDRENHVDKPRQVPLFISAGSVSKLKRFRCWNCEKRLYGSFSKYSEALFCRYCFATFFVDWLTGKIDDSQVSKIYLEKSKEPHISNGRWEDFQWDKKKKDAVRIKGSGQYTFRDTCKGAK